MSWFRAAMHLAFAEAQNSSIAFDCARIGRPAKELLVMVVSAPGENKHGVAPPQSLSDVAWDMRYRPRSLADPSPDSTRD